MIQSILEILQVVIASILFQKIVFAVVLSLILIGLTAYLTLLERKFIGWVQIRQGPNFVGYYGLLQPIADGLKVMSKELFIPYRADVPLFLLSPFLLFALLLGSWMVVPLTETMVVAPMDISLLMILALSSFSVYSVIFAGWASNSMYAVMGAMRCVAQMISYELSMGFGLMSVALMAGSMDLKTIVLSQSNFWYVLTMFPLAVTFFISALAESNRVPFDVAEGESEVTGGYSVEYSGILFAFFFFGEYLNVILLSALFTILFLGGWLSPFSIFDGMPLLVFATKVAIMIIIFLWIRSTLPRLRYDNIMALGWKVLLPFNMFVFYLVALYTVLMK